MSSEILCDLVLLSWNHLEETRPCLESLFSTVRTPARLFIVDNGSEPAVRDYLSGVKPRGMIRQVVLLQNERNEGFPAGMNRGIRASSAAYVCLLNNDLNFVAPGWLEEMIAVAQSNPQVGVINPASSTFGEVPKRGQSLEALSAGRRKRRGEYTEVGMCIGFCMLITREVVNKIGGLTEEVERFFFEDEDFSVRAQRAGFMCVVAEGAYVYHAEHKSVKKMPEREALFSRNMAWCHKKWGRWVRVAWPHFEPIEPSSEPLRGWLSDLIALARRRTHVYVYCALPSGVGPRQLFESVGLVPHADIHWFSFPPRWVAAAAAWRILVRQKKRFDIIVAPQGGWQAVFKALQWGHRAEISAGSNREQLLSLWKQKSQLA